jgi:hypothetical protein
MTPRADETTAMLVDLAIILMPMVGRQEAAKMLARQHVALAVAARVLVHSLARRPVTECAVTFA